MRKFVLLLIVVTLISIVFSIHTKQSQLVNEKHHREKINEYNRELQQSNTIRNSLVHRLDSLSAIPKDILRSDSVRVVEIRDIPKKLQNLTAKETQDKMIAFYTKSNETP